MHLTLAQRFGLFLFFSFTFDSGLEDFTSNTQTAWLLGGYVVHASVHVVSVGTLIINHSVLPPPSNILGEV